jgi:glucose/arabinose dehydrogenase
MHFQSSLIAALAATAHLITGASAACATTIKPTAVPVVADGYEVQVVATNLTTPRGIVFDTKGQMIVVEQVTGMRVLKLTDNGGACVTTSEYVTLIVDDSVSENIL